jgi:hypothetical protein
MLKAIPTHYDGRFFRSRTEARWALFFKVMEAGYDYEPEGYHLPSGRMYLPDFKLRLPSGYLWIEVKPRVEDSDGKMEEFAECIEGTDRATILPSLNAYFEMIRGGDLGSIGMDCYFGDGGFDQPFLFCACQICGTLGFEFDARSDRIGCCPTSEDKGYTHDHSLIMNALSIALSYRFEGGR